MADADIAISHMPPKFSPFDRTPRKEPKQLSHETLTKVAIMIPSAIMREKGFFRGKKDITDEAITIGNHTMNLYTVKKKSKTGAARASQWAWEYAMNLTAAGAPAEVRERARGGEVTPFFGMEGTILEDFKYFASCT